MVLLGGRLLRQAVLRQNALSSMDAFSVPEKTSALVEAVLAVVEGCQELVGTGTPANVLEEFDFSALIRLREEVGPHDVDVIGRCRDTVLAGLSELAR
jgi:V/A-type H+-transporting ATPase subunit A